MNLNDLRKPFEEKDIEWRIGQCGKTKDGKIWANCLAYIQARAIQDRLDDVCGPANWQVSYEVLSQGVISSILIKYEEQWVSKQDGAEQTDIESFKGGLSGALKRAGSAWGIGRYLYNLEAGFAEIVQKGSDGAKYAKTKEGDIFYWRPPKLPSWAVPALVAQEKEQTVGRAHSPLPNRAPVMPQKSTTPTEMLIETLAPQSNIWGDYTIKFDKFNKGKTLRTIGLPWVIKQLDYYKGKDIKSKALGEDLNAMLNFSMEVAKGNSLKIHKPASGAETTSYREPLHSDDPPPFPDDDDLPPF